MKNILRFIVFILFYCTLLSNTMMEFIVVGNHVELTPVPTPNLDDNIHEDSNENEEDSGEENDDDNERGTSVPLNPRSLHSSFFYLSIDGHTLYLYPDGTHDSMSLWVCDVNDNILIHEIFEMDGDTKSLILPQNFIGEYRVYLKVGTQYYVGGIDL